MNLIYEDDSIIICLKPVGVSSEDCPGGLPELLRQALRGDVYPVHRLDLNVGGLMVYGRNRKAAAILSRMVEDRKICKEYLAVIHGKADPEEGYMEDLLWKDSKKNKVFVVKRERKGVKRAKLQYWTLETGTYSLVRVRLETGRSHQIRVQFASRGWPLVGDHKYGSRDREVTPALWSYRLAFLHPENGSNCDWRVLPLFDNIWDRFSDSMRKLEAIEYDEV